MLKKIVQLRLFKKIAGKFISLVAILFFIVVACSHEKLPVNPPNVISESKLVLLLVDLHQADGYNSLHINTDKNIDLAALNNAVFLKHKVSAEQYNETIHFYSQNPQRLDTIYDHVLAKLGEMKVGIMPETKEKTIAKHAKTDGNKNIKTPKTEKPKRKKRKHYNKEE